MTRPTRKQVQQPTPQYAVVPTQSPTRANSYTSYQSHQSHRPQPGYQQPQPVYQQPQPIYQQPQPVYQQPQPVYQQPQPVYQQPQPVYQPSQQTQQQQPVYQQQQKQQSHIGGPRPVRSASANSRHSSRGHNGRNAIAMGVARGNIGGGYGPYSYHPASGRETGDNGTTTRFSTGPSSENSVATHSREKAPPPQPVAPTTATMPQSLWDRDPDIDDALHTPDPRGDSNFTLFSWRGWVNASAIVLLIASLITLFIGYPVMYHYTHLPPRITGWNVGGINGSGQIPVLPNVPGLIDKETPNSAFTRQGSDGKLYDLVFSDEFNTDGRSFYPGDDPYWEAADLHYWPTGDSEWYDPSAVTTANGKLVLTMTEQRVHDLNFQSGMLTSWNKFCFTTGYVEVSVSLPGSPNAPGLWPGVWTLGNLGRAGYGATTEGMWPYSYDTCDAGTFPGQIGKDGVPASAATGGLGGGILSSQPGQKLSACTCPGSDHPGPSVNVGRGVPEVDILEARVDTDKMQGEVSQSFQCAPYNLQYNWNNDTSATTIYNTDITAINGYKGGPYQQAVSTVTLIEDRFYGGNEFSTFAYELWSDPQNRDDGYITWYSNDVKTWTITSATVGPDTAAAIGQRLISEEPMYIILNLGIANSFQLPDFKHLVFPTKMYVDYVRVYQRRGTKNGVTCNPPNRPTSDYITSHIDAYMNANLTTWEQANQTFPRNSLYEGCSG